MLVITEPIAIFDGEYLFAESDRLFFSMTSDRFAVCFLGRYFWDLDRMIAPRHWPTDIELNSYFEEAISRARLPGTKHFLLRSSSRLF